MLRISSQRACCVSIRAWKPFSMRSSAGRRRQYLNFMLQRSGCMAKLAARVIKSLPMNTREAALHRALILWHANDNLRAVEAMEAITAEWPSDLCTAKFAEFIYYVLGQQHMGTRFRAHMTCLETMHATIRIFWP
jgi:hypothetical protein